MTRNQKLIILHGIYNRLAWIINDLGELNREEYDKNLEDALMQLKKIFQLLEKIIRKEAGQA